MTAFFTLDVDERRWEGQGFGARAEALRGRWLRPRHARLQSAAGRVGTWEATYCLVSYHETLQRSAASIAGLWIIHLFIGEQAMPTNDKNIVSQHH